MNEGAVQQTVTAGIIPNWWSVDNNTRQIPIANHQLPHHYFLAAPPHHDFMPTQTLSASSSSWNNDDCQELPDSWSQLLLRGLGSGEEDKNMQIKKLENWEQQLLINQSSSNSSSCGVIDNVKNENPYATYYGPPRDEVVEFQANPNNNNINSWSSHTHQMISGSSPKSSCVTPLSSNGNNMLDFSHQSLPSKIRIPDPSSPECNSTATAGGPASNKKAKIQHAPQPQSTFKVRKEKLGDRITALHQMVSPFGKTDTASVLLEAIGYIRFLQSQVEALSLPYLNSGSRNISHQNHVERNSLFPEDPGQLLNEKRLKKRGLISEQGSSDEEAKKDLRSRGLCLVPISSTLHVGNEINGADYWAQSAFGGNFQ